MKIIDKATALQWACDRCARRECCRSELETKLRAAALTPDTIAEVLDYLEDEGFIDSARYAHAFVHDKSRFERWGRLKIAAALRAKSIPRHDIDQALRESIDPDQYRTTLVQLLRQKISSLDFDPADPKAAFAASQKLVRYAASRGFEPELIFDEIDRLTSE